MTAEKRLLKYIPAKAREYVTWLDFEPSSHVYFLTFEKDGIERSAEPSDTVSELRWNARGCFEGLEKEIAEKKEAEEGRKTERKEVKKKMKYKKVWMLGGDKKHAELDDYISAYVAENGKRIECCHGFYYSNKWYTVDGEYFETLKGAKAYCESFTEPAESFEVETAEAVYTGGGIWVYAGITKSGLHFMAGDDEEWILLTKAPTMTTELTDEEYENIWYRDWQEENAIYESQSIEEAREMLLKVFDWLIKHDDGGVRFDMMARRDILLECIRDDYKFRYETMAEALGMKITDRYKTIQRENIFTAEVKTKKGALYFCCGESGTARITEPGGSSKQYYNLPVAELESLLKKAIRKANK